jgi:hypothetical protein
MSYTLSSSSISIFWPACCAHILQLDTVSSFRLLDFSSISLTCLDALKGPFRNRYRIQHGEATTSIQLPLGKERCNPYRPVLLTARVRDTVSKRQFKENAHCSGHAIYLPKDSARLSLQTGLPCGEDVRNWG